MQAGKHNGDGSCRLGSSGQAAGHGVSTGRYATVLDSTSIRNVSRLVPTHLMQHGAVSPFLEKMPRQSPWTRQSAHRRHTAPAARPIGGSFGRGITRERVRLSGCRRHERIGLAFGVRLVGRLPAYRGYPTVRSVYPPSRKLNMPFRGHNSRSALRLRTERAPEHWLMKESNPRHRYRAVMQTPFVEDIWVVLKIYVWRLATVLQRADGGTTNLSMYSSNRSRLRMR